LANAARPVTHSATDKDVSGGVAYMDASVARWTLGRKSEENPLDLTPRALGMYVHSTWTKTAKALRQSIEQHANLALLLGVLVCDLNLAPALAATGLSDTAPTSSRISLPIAAPSSSDDFAIGAALGNPLWGIPLHSMSATRERPLFSPSRRPPSPPIAAVAAPPPPPSKPTQATPPLTLLGTVLGDGERVGVFAEQGTKNVIRLRVGEGHGDWTLRSLHARAAILEQGRNQAMLALTPADAAVQEAASGSIPNAALPPRPVSQRAAKGPSRPSPGKWADGDGRVISAPPSRTTAQNAPRAQWTDGDGRTISPPTAPALLAAQSRAPDTWVDGDGNVITPPTTTQVRQIAQP